MTTYLRPQFQTNRNIQSISIVEFFKNNFNLATTIEGSVRYMLSQYVSRHGLTTAMQHLFKIGKVLRGLSD